MKQLTSSSATVLPTKEECPQEQSSGRPQMIRSFSVHPEEKDPLHSSPGQGAQAHPPLFPTPPSTSTTQRQQPSKSATTTPALESSASAQGTSEEPTTQSAQFGSLNLPTRSTSQPSELSRVRY